MSTYTSNTMSLVPSIAETCGILDEEYRTLLTAPSSMRLVELAGSVNHLGASAPGISWAQVDALRPGWTDALPTLSAPVMSAVRGGDLPMALQSVATSIAVLERHAVATAAAAALVARGYTITEAQGSRTNAIEGRRAHEVLLVRVQDQGRIETDHIGLSDSTCNDRQSEFVDAMRDHGVIFDDTVTVQHHDPRGGALIDTAHRAGGGSLAEGAVIDGDARPSALVGALHSSPSTRRQRATVGR